MLRLYCLLRYYAHGLKVGIDEDCWQGPSSVESLWKPNGTQPYHAEALDNRTESLASISLIRIKPTSWSPMFKLFASP